MAVLSLYKPGDVFDGLDGNEHFLCEVANWTNPRIADRLRSLIAERIFHPDFGDEVRRLAGTEFVTIAQLAGNHGIVLEANTAAMA